MRTTFARALLLATLSLTQMPAVSHAQVIHLPPVFRPVLNKDTVVLRIAARHDLAPTTDDEKKSVARLDALTLAVQDDQLLISSSTGDVSTVPLGDRKIRDVIAELRLKYRDSLVVTSDFPLYSTSLIGQTAPKPLSSALEIHANPDEPIVGLNFGVVFALTDGTSAGNSGILSNAGFQLDLAGNHQVLSPSSTRKHILPTWITAQARLGLNGNQQLSVRTEGETNQGDQTGPQFGAALEQADQLALTAQVDLAYELVPGRMDMILTLPSYGISWAKLDPFAFPPIAVGDGFVTDTVFDPTSVALAQEALQRVLPLSEIGSTAVFQFRRSGVPAFYVGGGVVWKEVPVRQVEFRQVSSDSLPVANSLVAKLDNPMDWYWRAIFGARLAGVLDLRVDAAGPIGGRDGEPLLRVLLGHSFPVVRE